MGAINISDLSYLNALEDIEQLQKGGSWGGYGIEQDNDAFFKINAIGKVNQNIIAVAQGNNIGGDQTVIAVAQGNLNIGGFGIEQDNDLWIHW